MLVVKALHMAMVPADSAAERERLLLMANKLFKFMTPLGVLAVLLGLWLWFGFGFSGGWLHAKSGLVAVLAVYHWHCGVVLRAFNAGHNARSHVWFRFYNELPVLVLFAIVFLVVLKPF